MRKRLFQGFPRESMTFFNELAENNERMWFAAHKEDYENYVLEPARQFVLEMGGMLQQINPDIIFEPKTDKSIFRLHRDIRFSKNKLPYKNHLGIFFWEGFGKKMECSGYYFHFQPPTLMLGAGIHTFSPQMLKTYRQAVVDDEMGPELVKAIEKIKNEGYEIGGKHYKRVPHGFDPENANKDLLLHNGLYAALDEPIPDVFYSDELLFYCFDKYKDMKPLYDWLVKMTEKVARF